MHFKNHEGRAELTLVDLDMPRLHGLDFIRLAAGKCRFIVTTGFRDFAVEGFELDVLDYLLKPVSQERFIRAAGKALQILRPPGSQDASFIKCIGRQALRKVYHNDVLYIKSEGKISKIYLKGSSFTSPSMLADLENLLPGKRFVRVHKSYIVSIENIDMVRANMITIGEEHIPVGSQYMERFSKIVR